MMENVKYMSRTSPNGHRLIPVLGESVLIPGALIGLDPHFNLTKDGNDILSLSLILERTRHAVVVLETSTEAVSVIPVEQLLRSSYMLVCSV